MRWTVARVERHDAWLSVSGFVRPATGQRGWCLRPRVTAAAMGVALAAGTRDEGRDATRRAVLVVAQPGWRVAHDLARPDGSELVALPVSAPDRPPAERRWPLLDAPAATCVFADLDALEAVLATRCRTVEADPPRRKPHSRFLWRPAAPPAFVQ